MNGQNLKVVAAVWFQSSKSNNYNSSDVWDDIKDEKCIRVKLSEPTNLSLTSQTSTSNQKVGHETWL